MANAITTQNLLAELKKQAGTLGLKVSDKDGQQVTGEAENITAKWFLGGRKVTDRMSCRPVDADHSLHFREAIERTTAAAGWKFQLEGGRMP